MAVQKKIPRRKRFFVGCEGKSEQGYAMLLQRFADDQGLAVHIESKDLRRAGDPLALVEKAVAEIALGERKPKSEYKSRFLIFDTDRLGQCPARDLEMRRLAAKSRLTLVRQDLCFESVLLRHFTGHLDDNPATSNEAFHRLTKVLAGYQKSMSAIDLAKNILITIVRK